MKLLDPSKLIADLGVTVGDFWQWAYSDIMSNRNRSIFAEYLVGVALGVVETPRIEWASVDLYYKSFKIEVKASAYCQSWPQGKLSEISFSFRKAVFWNELTGKYEGEPTHCADAYVLCLYAEKECENACVLNIGKWEFYVISTERLNQEFGAAKALSLASVKRIAAPCKFDELKAAVDSVLEARNNDG